MDSNGLSDPFCVVRVNNAKKFKTNVAYETLSPVWNESVSIAMPQEGDKISFVSSSLYIDMTSARSLLSKEDGMFRHRVLFKVIGKLQLIGKKTGKSRIGLQQARERGHWGVSLYIVKI